MQDDYEVLFPQLDEDQQPDPAQEPESAQQDTPAQELHQDIPAPEVPPIQAAEEPQQTFEEAPQQAREEAPQQAAAPYDEAYRHASPFADSPYEMRFQPTPKPPKKKKNGHWGKRVLAALLVVALVAAGCGITAAAVNSKWQAFSDETGKTISQLNQKLDELEEEVKKGSHVATGDSISGTTNTSVDGLTPGQVFARCADSVVAITSQSMQGVSSGSGFVLSEDGYIVSNYHVVEGGTDLTVTMRSGDEHTAKLIGYDDQNDISLLKIEATGLKAVTLGSSNDLIVGDMVVAIGNPLGELSFTQTVGYVSGKDRTVTTDGSIINMLQTDTAINPGNSGGPLFNMKGEVVGITTAKYSGTTSSGASIEGIGFAIPISDVNQKIQDLMNFGYVTGPYLGVSVQDTNPSMGVYVRSVVEGSCAQTAGVRPRDVIVALGDYEIRDLTSLTRALQNFKAGDTTTISVLRGGRVQSFSITLDERPHETVNG